MSTANALHARGGGGGGGGPMMPKGTYQCWARTLNGAQSVATEPSTSDGV